MKRVIALLAFVQCGLLTAAEETPQEKRANDPIQFQITAGAEYTDNRDGLDIKKSNVDLYIAPRLSLALKFQEITSFTMSYTPTFRYRSNASIIQNESQLFHDLYLNFKHKIVPQLEFRVSEAFNITDDPSVQENGSTLTRDSSFVFSQTELGMNYAFSRLSNMDVLGRYTTKAYDDSQRAIESDEDHSEAGVTFWHQPAKRFALIGSLLFSMVDYSEYLSVDRGFDSVYAGVGLEEVLNPRVRFGVRAGLQNVTYADDSLDSDSQPYVNANAQFSPIPTTRITASFAHSIRESFIFPFSSQSMTDFGVRLDWDNPNIPGMRLGLMGNYRVGDYEADKIISRFLEAAATDPVLMTYAQAYGLRDSGTENTFVAALEVAFKIGHGTTLKLVQSYENVESDVRWSFDRNSTNLMLTREF